MDGFKENQGQSAHFMTRIKTWRGLALRPGGRVRVRWSAGEVWYFVAGATTDDDATTAFLSRELDGL